MYEYDKEYWKQVLYDVSDYDELEEEDEEEIGPACYDMLEAAIEVLIETGHHVSRQEVFEALLQKTEQAQD